MMQSTRQLHEDLAWLSAQLEAARDLEHAAEERHSDEDMAETDAALEGRRDDVRGLRERRTRLVKELGRRAVAENGWEPDRNLP
jgi:predicted  nucleic acid-binding Zn-ribbon protein